MLRTPRLVLVVSSLMTDVLGVLSIVVDDAAEICLGLAHLGAGEEALEVCDILQGG